MNKTNDPQAQADILFLELYYAAKAFCEDKGPPEERDSYKLSKAQDALYNAAVELPHSELPKDLEDMLLECIEGNADVSHLSGTGCYYVPEANVLDAPRWDTDMYQTCKMYGLYAQIRVDRTYNANGDGEPFVEFYFTRLPIPIADHFRVVLPE